MYLCLSVCLPACLPACLFGGPARLPLSLPACLCVYSLGRPLNDAGTMVFSFAEAAGLKIAKQHRRRAKHGARKTANILLRHLHGISHICMCGCQSERTKNQTKSSLEVDSSVTQRQLLRLAWSVGQTLPASPAQCASQEQDFSTARDISKPTAKAGSCSALGSQRCREQPIVWLLVVCWFERHSRRLQDMKANNARHLRLSKIRYLVHVAIYQGRGSKVTIFEQPNCEIAGLRAHLQLGYLARKGSPSFSDQRKKGRTITSPGLVRAQNEPTKNLGLNK